MTVYRVQDKQSSFVCLCTDLNALSGYCLPEEPPEAEPGFFPFAERMGISLDPANCEKEIGGPFLSARLQALLKGRLRGVYRDLCGRHERAWREEEKKRKFLGTECQEKRVCAGLYEMGQQLFRSMQSKLGKGEAIVVTDPAVSIPKPGPGSLPDPAVSAGRSTAPGGAPSVTPETLAPEKTPTWEIDLFISLAVVATGFILTALPGFNLFSNQFLAEATRRSGWRFLLRYRRLGERPIGHLVFERRLPFSKRVSPGTVRRAAASSRLLAPTPRLAAVQPTPPVPPEVVAMPPRATPPPPPPAAPIRRTSPPAYPSSRSSSPPQAPPAPARGGTTPRWPPQTVLTTPRIPHARPPPSTPPSPHVQPNVLRVVYEERYELRFEEVRRLEESLRAKMVELIEQNQNTIRNWEARVTWVILERLGIASEFPQLKGCLVITSDEWASLSKLIERHRSRLQFQCRPLQFTEEVMVPVLYDQTAYGKEVGVLGEIAQADLVNFNQDLVELLKEQGQGLGEARNLVESFLNKIAHSLLILAA